jgi:nitroimidazol reductase NimA-like FMN-containing flavoprotein (pyridoxamine 5'-phosphate oxidase superfamily)
MDDAPEQPPSFAPTDRTTLHRRAQRGAYDRATVEQILDEALLCHLGFVVDGQPYVLPTIHARVGDVLYLHGAPASRMLRTLRDGVPVCVTVTLVDGVVLARSAFHHSMNYRSVVALGTATEVTDLAEKRRALEALVEHVAPGHTGAARAPTDGELRGTMVLALPLREVSAKVRSGPPVDDPEDQSLPCWAGEIPVRMTTLAPVPDALVAPGTEPPASVIDAPRFRAR